MRYVFAGLSALILSSTMAMANNTVTDYSSTFNQTAFDSLGNLTIDLAQFDPTFGMLTGATLTFAGVTGPQFEVLNLANVAGTAVGSTAVTYSLTGNGANLTETASSGQQTVSVMGAPGDLASSSPQIIPFDLSQTSGLTGLTGNGTLSFTLNQIFTSSGTTITPDAQLAVGGDASSNFGLSITYDYTAVQSVPEPMSIAMLGTGLIGLAKVTRRRRV